MRPPEEKRIHPLQRLGNVTLNAFKSRHPWPFSLGGEVQGCELGALLHVSRPSSLSSRLCSLSQPECQVAMMMTTSQVLTDSHRQVANLATMGFSLDLSAPAARRPVAQQCTRFPRSSQADRAQVALLWEFCYLMNRFQQLPQGLPVCSKR